MGSDLTSFWVEFNIRRNQYKTIGQDWHNIGWFIYFHLFIFKEELDIFGLPVLQDVQSFILQDVQLFNKMIDGKVPE